VIAHILIPRSIAVADRYNRAYRLLVFGSFHNEPGVARLSPRHPQGFVDNLLMTYPVGSLQRQEIEQRRGLQPGSFDYNEIPTSSCQSFCWKARQSFDVPFFCVRPALRAFTSLRDMSLPRNGCAVVISS
jgi:hypothetical protein